MSESGRASGVTRLSKLVTGEGIIRVVKVLAVLLVLALAGYGLWLGQSPSFPSYGRAHAEAPRPVPVPKVEEPDPEPLPLEGVVVVLDPGHNAENAANPQVIFTLVPDGRGGEKPCNTVGTATNSGYPEYEFTWDVAERMRVLLEVEGATVVLTRQERGVGPCVDERGQFPQNHDADVMLSIHGNGSESSLARGFFAMVSEPPLNDAQGEPSRALAQELIEALSNEGFPRSNMVDGAVMFRSDLGTLNHSERPAVMMELAEFRNPDEAVAVQDPEVRQQYADALTSGLIAWLLGSSDRAD